MTTELTKAAQQALEALKLCYAVVEYPANGTSRQDKAIAALERALTQRPAAQTEQATPEPVGEPVARVELMQTGGNAGLATRIVEIDDPLRERLRPGDLLFTHPAPGVPEPLTVRIVSFAETNGKRNWTAMFVRTKPWDGLIGNAGGITIARGELWNRVAYAAERARCLLGERGTEPDILAYGDDVSTPDEWKGHDPESLAAAQAKGGEQ